MAEMVFSKSIKQFTTEWKENLKQRITMYGKTPTLGIVQVGDNEASNRYVRNKVKDCEEVGIKATVLKLPENIPFIEFLIKFEDFQKENNGIIIQLPVPPQINMGIVKTRIDPDKDVDGFLYNSVYDPCTPGGIMRYLDYCNFDLDGKHVVICGRSKIVGKPLAQMMTDANATVTLCHSHTKNLHNFYQTADLIVSAVGKPKFLNCYSIHVPVVDVGINFDKNGKLVGDCINTENRDVTPVPGGVGLLTRCMLLENVVNAAFWRYPQL